MLTLILLLYSVEKEKEERKNRDGNGETTRIGMYCGRIIGIRNE